MYRSSTQFHAKPTLIYHHKSKSPADFCPGSPDLDSRYSWVVCFAGLIANMVGVGVIVAFAIYVPLLMDAFPGTTDSDVSWAGSICISVNMGAGILVGKLLSKYGARVSAQLSAVLFLIGFGGTSYATSLWHVYITYGLLVGVASCLCFLQGIVIVTQFFEKRRSTAVGITIAGVGMVVIAVPCLRKPNLALTFQVSA
jgi:MFS family permease